MKSAAPGEIAKPRARKTKAASKVEAPAVVAAPKGRAATPATTPATTAATTAVTRATTAVATRATTNKAEGPAPVDAETRNRMVAEAAYYLAERRGFAPGYEAEDWLLAAAEVDRRLAGKKVPPA